MIRRLLTPDRLFDHPWRSGHPFCRRTGRLRRWAMVGLLLVLIFVIGGYAYLTDASRVRGMAEQYLGQLVGGRVTVGAATLSVFEGLRLDDVQVHVDDGGDADSLLFSAQTFVINYDPSVMLGGRLEATSIIAQKPYVHLTENIDTGQWNWHRLGTSHKRRTRPSMGRSSQPLALPEVMLRNARVEISEIRGGAMTSLGFLTLDGQLLPAKAEPGPEANEGRRYTFDLQSRGLNEGVGPYVTGTVAPGTGQVSARLMNFAFGRDVLSILPAEVRRWWERHELSGRVNIPVLSYTPPRSGGRAKFKVETELNGVTLAVPAEEWMTGQEARRLATARQAIGMVGDFYALAGVGEGSGFRVRGSVNEGEEDSHFMNPEPRTLNPSDENPSSRLASMAHRVPVRLQNVAGKFLFTEDGIEIRDVSGRVENNGLNINGRIEGYRPDAKAQFRVTSFDTEDLTIPANPRYINSLPPQVRELYDQIRPQGTGRLLLEIARPEVGAQPVVSGQLDVIDGQFLFDKFPYPLRNATGRILFGRDPETGMDRVAIQRLRGRGIESGPNRDTIVQVDGKIEPLGPTSGVNITVRAENVHSEEALRLAFPKEVRDALKVFDAGNTGRYPVFAGDFECRVVRPLGYRTPWSFDTDIKLRDASGTLVMFPYPLRNVTGDLHIRTGYVDIINIRSKKGDATIDVNGRVAWGSSRQQSGDPRNGDGRTGPTTAPVTAVVADTDAPRDPFRLPAENRPKTSIKVSVKKAPIDADLIAALPPAQGAWLTKTQPSGALDVEGRIFEVPPAPGEIDDGRARIRPVDFAFDVNIAGGAMRPFGGQFDVKNIAGRLKVLPTRIELTGLAGRRGDGADVTADGTIDWAGGKRATGDVIVTGTNLPLDAALYEMIPSPAKRAWDELQPSGAVDVEVTYRGPVGSSEPSETATTAVASPASPGAADAVAVSVAAADTVLAPVTLAPPETSVGVVLRPRGASVTFKPVPYPLENVKGTVRLDGDTVKIEEITGKHGTAELAMSGTGKLGARQVWDLKLSAKRVPSDDLLRKALPTALSELVTSLKLAGELDIDFSRLLYRGPAAEAGLATAAAAGVETVHLNPTAAQVNPEIDIAVSIGLHKGSLETGVALDAVEGTAQLEAAVREGRLAVMTGRIDATSMRMSERAVKDFRCEVVKPAGKSELRLDDIRGELAGGEMAGAVKIVYPEVGTGGSKYAAELILRGADVRALVDEPDSELTGTLTASLAVEGSWDDPSARRGRGDVVASGKKMYKIPLLLGLSQVTNLTVPISSPFNEATARYSIQGETVAFEQIEMRASNMIMTGTGNLDFASKKVDLTFVTDNPGGLKVPFLNDLFQGARQELLKIHVRGTIQEPKVSAGLMGTFTTTVDEVFKGDGPTTRKRK